LSDYHWFQTCLLLVSGDGFPILVSFEYLEGFFSFESFVPRGVGERLLRWLVQSLILASSRDCLSRACRSQVDLVFIILCIEVRGLSPPVHVAQCGFDY